MPPKAWRAGLAAFVLFVCFGPAELKAQRNRIAGPVHNNRRVALQGHLHPNAIAEDDEGSVDPSMVLPAMTIVLKPSAAQQTALEQLLQEQQDPASSNYHRWLTPDEYADRFGVSQGDLDQITAWLKQQNLNVTGMGRNRTWISLTGTAAQVEGAFGTAIHHYNVSGRRHFANTADPTVPAVFSGVVRGIHGLNDFHLQPRKTPLRPLYTSSGGNHYLAPDDVATIYNLKPLYDAGVDGSGQKVVVVGQTQIDVTDIQKFRSRFSLPASDPQTVLIPTSKDPGKIKDEMVEADLDIEWAGAVARGATVVYVYSTDVMDSLQYAIDQNLAPVLSMSYGLCEAQTTRSDALLMQSWARQANAQGITWLSASGDSGGADCYSTTSRVGTLSVDVPASIPEVTGVGGTEFQEGSGQFWNSSNGSSSASVLSYIPETVWNDSGTNDPSAGGGGASTVFAKPTWQAGAGVPGDGARDVPDVSLNSSASHDGYLVYTGGQLSVVGGTSVAAPAFAGITLLANHFMVSQGIQASAGLGNINPKLYSLAQTAPGVFHDITAGNNTVTITCGTRARNCTPGSYGYNAGAGYDQATGLGSVDAARFVGAWAGEGVPRATTSMVLTSNAKAITPFDSVTLTATVRTQSADTPQGSVTFFAGSTSLGSAPLVSGTATLTVNGSQLSVSSGMVTAQFAGDTAHSAATASVDVSVVNSFTTAPAITSVSNGASFRQAYAPGMVLSVFGSNFSPVELSASTLPLPFRLGGVSAAVNGIPAPLYYVSAGQLNLQIPYETPADSTAQLVVSSNGRQAAFSLGFSSAAPGIFADSSNAPVPDTSAKRGQQITLYVTGVGALVPAVATGDAPASGTALASLPRPAQNVIVTVANIAAPIQFIGTPAGLVGVTQINYVVPADAPLGVQPVVVTVGRIASAPVNLTITN